MKKGVSEMTDPGIDDKRLLLDEREFYSALAVMQREGNTLSRIVRDAWDCLPVLETLTKNEPTRVDQRASSPSSATSRSTSCGRPSTTPRWRTAMPTAFCSPASPQQGAAARRRRGGR